MRVGLVVRGGVDRSGRERVIPALLWLIERLARRHDLHVFVLHQCLEPCTFSLLGATVHDLGQVRALRAVRWRARLSRLMRALERAGPFDLLHAYWALPAGLVTTVAARRLRVPSVVTADSGEWTSIPDIQYGLQRRWVDRRAVAASMRGATRVTVCTEHMAELARRNGLRADVIPIGVPRPGAGPIDRPAGPPWRLLHVASINPVKDHPTLLRALAHIVAREPRVHLDLVGEDTLDGAVQRLAKDLGVDPYITFHGFQPSDELAHYYARSHVLVVSSRHEAAGVVILEAAASGVATVGTAVGYLADWSAEPRRALSVPVGDPRALGEAILALLADPVRRSAMTAAAEAWAAAHDADWTAARFSGLYEELVRVS
jgi:glycosyltransferase involved in cell wall biosynthesis